MVVLAANLVTGTYARSLFTINPQESDGSESAGVTLHNHGTVDNQYQNIFIENWGDVSTFARIRLREYMEFGEGAGNKNPSENFSTPLIPTAELNNTDTWHIHIPHNNETPNICSFGYEASLFHTYWEWTMGGQKYFYPVPEHKRSSAMESGDRYVDSGSPPHLHANSPDSPYGIPVSQTMSSEVVTMAQWVNAGKPIGNYWVIDTDGWAYWANAIAPGTATGLLLHRTEMIEAIPSDFFYAIHVEMQVVYNMYGTPDYFTRWGEEHNGYGWTEKGEALMQRVTQDDPEKANFSNENIESDSQIIGDTIYLLPGSSATLSLRDANESEISVSPYDISGINLVQLENNLWHLSLDESLPEFLTFFLTLQQGESIFNRIAGTIRVVVIPEGAIDVVEGRNGTHFVSFGNNSFRPLWENVRGDLYVGCWISGSDIVHEDFAIISTLPIINDIVYLRQGEHFSLSVIGTSSEFQRISGNFPLETEYFSISGNASQRTNLVYAKENAPVGTSFDVHVSQHCSDLTLLGERQTVMVTVIPKEADGVLVGESGRIYIEYNGSFRELTENEMGPPISEDQIT